MSKIIEKTVVDKYAPHDTNVDWLDVSGDKPVKKSYINGKWQVISGGGSTGSSNPTEADATKVWQVTPVQKGTKTEETVIIPEQTCQMVNSGGRSTACVLQDVDENFGLGFIGIAILDEIEYNIEWSDSNPTRVYIGESECFINSHNDNYRLVDQNNGSVHTIKVITRETEPVYDYNWAPGVKIPIPTAEDEGKILVVTKVEGDNTSTIVPEQEVPADNETPLTDVDLKYFVPGNTVTATVVIQQGSDAEEKKGGDVLLKGAESSNSETMIVSGIIKQADDGVDVVFNEGQENEFEIVKFPYSPFEPDGPKLLNTKSSTDTEYVLVTNLCEIIDSGEGSGNLRSNTISYATIKLEYGEPDYEYQLQENSGGGSTGGASGVVIQDGSIINTIPFRQATEADVAKFSSGGVVVGQDVLEINGVIPYVMQVGIDSDPWILLLISTILSEHVAYYASSGMQSPNADANFETVLFYISDDAMLLALHQEG